MKKKGIEALEYTLKVDSQLDYTVSNPDGVSGFKNPATLRGPWKIYLVGDSKGLRYVGVTKQPMASRINLGLKASQRKLKGYSGYAWRNIRTKLHLQVCVISSLTKNRAEAIEAEIVFRCRSKTGKWPLSQTEIHFRPPSVRDVELAKEIYDTFVAANKSLHRTTRTLRASHR